MANISIVYLFRVDLVWLVQIVHNLLHRQLNLHRQYFSLLLGRGIDHFLEGIQAVRDHYPLYEDAMRILLNGVEGGGMGGSVQSTSKCRGKVSYTRVVNGTTRSSSRTGWKASISADGQTMGYRPHELGHFDEQGMHHLQKMVLGSRWWGRRKATP